MRKGEAGDDGGGSKEAASGGSGRVLQGSRLKGKRIFFTKKMQHSRKHRKELVPCKRLCSHGGGIGVVAAVGLLLILP